MELWGHPWWILGLYSLAALFMLLFALFLASHRVIRRSLPQGPGAALASTPMESTPLGYTALEGVTMRPSHEGAWGSRLNPWVTRIFIVIVLQCAAIYMVSAYPGTGSPFWLGIILQGFTYGSAAVYYASWGEGS